MENLFVQFQPVIVEIVGVVIAAIVGWVGVYAKTHFEASTQKLLQDVFQKALEQAAGLALTQMPSAGIAGQLPAILKSSDPAIQKAVDYVVKSVPDTMKKFDLTPFDIAEKVIAKIGVLQAGKKS